MNPHMAMAITMRIVIRIFFRHRGHTRAIAKCPLYAYKTHTKLPCCVFRSGHEDTTNMTAHSGATGLPDLAGDLSWSLHVKTQMRAWACLGLLCGVLKKLKGKSIKIKT
jgi:hypothetical protein